MSEKYNPAGRTADLIEELREHELSTLLHDVARIADGVGCLTDLAVRITRDRHLAAMVPKDFDLHSDIARLWKESAGAASSGQVDARVNVDALERVLRALAARIGRI